MQNLRSLKTTFPYCYNIAFENSAYLNRALKSKYKCYSSFLKNLFNNINNPATTEAKIHESFRAIMWFETELYAEHHNSSQHAARFDLLNASESAMVPQDLSTAYSEREEQKSKNYRLKRHVTIARIKDK